MTRLQKIGAVSALLEAAIYVAAFVYYGALLQFPSDAPPSVKFAFLAENQLSLSVMNLVGYVLFGVLLALLVLALHQRLEQRSPALARTAAVFGFIWVGLVIASGMIANIGLATVISLAATDPEQAQTVALAVNIVVEGLGGGNEVVGGLWVLLLSLAAIKGNVLSTPLNWLGVAVGTAGILTIYPAEVFTEIFGLSQILWFIWLGIQMLRQEPPRA